MPERRSPSVAGKGSDMRHDSIRGEATCPRRQQGFRIWPLSKLR